MGTFFLTDEAQFHLSGYINIQTSKSAETPHSQHENALHWSKSVVSSQCLENIVGPLFFEGCERVKRDGTIFSICRTYTLLMTLLGILENTKIKTTINGLQYWVASSTAHPYLLSHRAKASYETTTPPRVATTLTVFLHHLINSNRN